jgi:pheromone shutdown-related protein TraB
MTSPDVLRRDADFTAPGDPDSRPWRDAYPGDVHVLGLEQREVIVVATAHISRESAQLVRHVIEAERPDAVCIELDAQRYKTLAQRQRFEALDLKQVIRQQQLTPLILNLILVSYQQQLGGQLGVLPGTEFLEAAEAAEAQGIPIVLCDREVRVTLRRAWGALSLWHKLKLFASVLGSVVERPHLTEEDLRRLREQDVGSRLIEELGQVLPGIKHVLIDERDTYLAERIKRAAGDRIVAVVGAGHVGGIRAALQENRPVDLSALETVPPASAFWKILGWGMPAVILAAIAWIGWQRGAAAAGDNVLYWILVTGLPSMIGTMLALGHPLTALSALLAAPITTLTPLLGVGYIAAFVQAYLRPPRVYELRSVAQDFRVPRQWFTNRVLRILLVFLLSTLGGAGGMFAGSAGLISSLLHR